MVEVPLKAKPETRTWVQVAHSEGDPGKYSETARE